jgi:hypothetical protein
MLLLLHGIEAAKRISTRPEPMIETFRGQWQEDVEAEARKWVLAQRRIRSVRICCRMERMVLAGALRETEGDGVGWIVDVYYDRSYDGS